MMYVQAHEAHTTPLAYALLGTADGDVTTGEIP